MRTRARPTTSARWLWRCCPRRVLGWTRPLRRSPLPPAAAGVAVEHLLGAGAEQGAVLPDRCRGGACGLAGECEPQHVDVQIVKGTLGAFHDTGLDGVLRSRGIHTVVLGGLVTHFGVESTGRAADEHGYSVVFVSDAMAGLHGHAHTFAVEYIFPRLGAVCTSAELMAAAADPPVA